MPGMRIIGEVGNKRVAKVKYHKQDCFIEGGLIYDKRNTGAQAADAG